MIPNGSHIYSPVINLIRPRRGRIFFIVRVIQLSIPEIMTTNDLALRFIF